LNRSNHAIGVTITRAKTFIVKTIDQRITIIIDAVKAVLDTRSGCRAISIFTVDETIAVIV
jgi:hypothetical protein